MVNKWRPEGWSEIADKIFLDEISSMMRGECSNLLEAGATAMLEELRNKGERFQQTRHVTVYSVTLLVEGKTGTMVYIPDDEVEDV